MIRLPLLIAFLGVTALEGQPAASGPYTIGPGISPPSVISKVDPSYSPEALEARLQGVVVLSLVVQTDGAATDLSVVRSLGLGLDEKAMEAVQKWRFRPGAKNGQSVPVFATVELAFRLPASRQAGKVSTVPVDIPDANFRPPDVAWLEIKPGKYGVLTITASDMPLKPSELLLALGPLNELSAEQKAALNTAKPFTTRMEMVCFTAGSLNSSYYIPESGDTSCRRTVISSSSTKREMMMLCGPSGNTLDLSVSFEAVGPDAFEATRRSSIIRDTFKMDVTTVMKAKWLAADCTDSK